MPRAWLLTSALLLGVAVGQIAGIVATLLVTTPVRPDAVIGLVVGVPSIIGTSMILLSGRRWLTTLGAFILAIAPGWFGVLVAIQLVSSG